MNITLDKVVKGTLGTAVLVLLVITVTRWWGDYRVAAVESESATPSTSAAVTETATPAEGEGSAPAESAPANASEATSAPLEPGDAASATVVVLIEGLNFRVKADRDSKAIRALSKGEKVVLLKKIDSWYQVKDSKGDIGWISSNPAYAKVEE